VIRQVALQRLNAAYQGRAREESYLELAQEHFLDWMRASGLLDEVIFKGGTSLRKFAFGLQGRFSLDLDFATTDRAVGELVIDALESGFTREGVRFVGFDVDKPALKGAWTAEAPGLGVTGLACRLDFSTRPLMLPPVLRPRAELPSVNQKDLGFAPVAVRIADLRETCAEKLARFRRALFARDVYDLHALLPFVRHDVDMIRELLLYKVYFDVVDDGRGTAPFKLGSEFTGKRVADVQDSDELGAMTGRTIDLDQMLNQLAGTFGAMAQPLSPQEEVIARCSRGDRYRVEQWLHERRAAFYRTG
jgi:predicted nucleotidyltransferase component of viral defense system